MNRVDIKMITDEQITQAAYQKMADDLELAKMKIDSLIQTSIRVQGKMEAYKELLLEIIEKS